MTKLYIASDLGCVYRLNNGQLEYAPLLDNRTFDIDDFAYVEPELVGEEEVTFLGVNTNLYGVYKTVRKQLEESRK